MMTHNGKRPQIVQYACLLQGTTRSLKQFERDWLKILLGFRNKDYNP